MKAEKLEYARVKLIIFQEKWNEKMRDKNEKALNEIGVVWSVSSALTEATTVVCRKKGIEWWNENQRKFADEKENLKVESSR